MLNKFYIYISKSSLFLLNLIFFANIVLAQGNYDTGNQNNTGTTSGGGVQIKNPIDLQNLAELVTRFTSLIIPISVIGFVFCVIYAGYLRMFTGTNPQGEQKSMKVATNAAIGFALIFLANAFVYIVSSILGFSFKI